MSLLLLLGYAPAPLAPTLLSPEDLSIVSIGSAAEHTWDFNPAYTGQTQGEYALRRMKVS